MSKTIYTCGYSTPDQRSEYLIKIPLEKEIADIKFGFSKKDDKMYLAYFTGDSPDENVLDKDAFIKAGGQILKWEGDAPLCTINEEFTTQSTNKLWDEICKKIKEECCMLDRRSALSKGE